MKIFFRKELLFAVLILAGCDSNEPTEEQNADIFFGTYRARGNVGVTLTIGKNEPTIYWAGVGLGSHGYNMTCEGTSRVLTCLEDDPVAFSSAPYTLTKTSYGLDMEGHFDHIFDEVDP